MQSVNGLCGLGNTYGFTAEWERCGLKNFNGDTTEFLNSLGEGTQRVYRAGLVAFQKFYGKPLGIFLDEVEEDLRKPRRGRNGKRRVARNVLNAFSRELEKRKLAPKTIRTYLAAVQSFAGYFQIPISTRYLKAPDANPVSKKFPWTLETVAKFVGMIPQIELKSAAVSLFQSGLGVSDLLALTYGDIKREYENGTSPLCLDLARIKTKVPFMTFVGEWAIHLLHKYLEGRKLKFDTSIYSISHRSIDHHFQILAEKFYGEYRIRNPCRPHSLRAAFRTLLGDEKMDRDVVKFFMGQRLPDQDRAYHVRSREGWRALYAKYEYALTPKNWRKI